MLGILIKKAREVGRDYSEIAELLKLKTGKDESSLSPMTMQKNWRQYIGTVSQGERKRLQGKNSEVYLDIPDGSPGIYMCRVHTDHTRFTRHGIIPESECMIGPLVELGQLQSASNSETHKSSFFEICIPHCLAQKELWKDVKVRHGDILPGKDNPKVLFQEIFTSEYGDDPDMYYEMDEKFIKIFTKRFCHFICTACRDNDCSPRMMVFLYGNLKKKLEMSFEEKTSAEIKVFLCCELYSIADYKLVC